MVKLQTWLKKNEACSEGVQWAKSAQDMQGAWETCQRPDWMLWGLGKIGYSDDRVMRLYACACVRGTPTAKGTVWDLLTDKRSKKAIEVAELFAEGKATAQARAAACAAAGDAAWAAAGAAARAAAWDAARDAAWAWQANKLREMVPWEEVEKAIKSREKKSVV